MRLDPPPGGLAVWPRAHWQRVPSGPGEPGAGLRVLRPVDPDATRPVWAHDHAGLLGASAIVIGFSSGLLANGGGFLLVPLFLLAVGLDMNRATGTSLVVASALTIPTLITHAAIGDIDWAVSLVFALGLIPGAWVGALASKRFATDKLRGAFGFLLVGFAVWFLVREVPALLACPALPSCRQRSAPAPVGSVRN